MWCGTCRHRTNCNAPAFWWTGGREPASVSALAYVAGPGNPNFLGPAPVVEIVAQICRSQGPSGANLEYLLKLRDALDAMGAHDPIYEFQGLQWMLADMSIKLAAARALVWRAAANTEGGFPDALAAAQAKIFTSEAAIEITNEALQVFGAAGYSRNNPLERMVRDARMFTIGGGTAQVLRTLVATRILDRRLPQTRDGFTKLAESGRR